MRPSCARTSPPAATTGTSWCSPSPSCCRSTARPSSCSPGNGTESCSRRRARSSWSFRPTRSRRGAYDSWSRSSSTGSTSPGTDRRSDADSSVKTLRIIPGRTVPPEAVGAVLARDLEIDGQRWSKGRRLTPADAGRLAGIGALEPSHHPGAGGAAGEARSGRDAGASGSVTLLVLDADDVHEDDAALRLARAVAGPGVELRGPASSRVDLLAAADGVLRVRTAAVERLDRIDPLLVFTLYDGQ